MHSSLTFYQSHFLFTVVSYYDCRRNLLFHCPVCCGSSYCSLSETSRQRDVARREQEASGLPSFREQRQQHRQQQLNEHRVSSIQEYQQQLNEQGARIQEYINQRQQQNAAAAAPTPSAPVEQDSPETRKQEVMKHLYHRTLEHGESVRNLSMLLAAANDHYADSSTNAKENVITRSWRSAKASVNKFVGAGKNECSICLDPYVANETVCWAKNDDCDHIFHQDCIVQWLVDHDDCPLCRTNLLVYDDDDDDESHVSV